MTHLQPALSDNARMGAAITSFRFQLLSPEGIPAEQENKMLERYWKMQKAQFELQEIDTYNGCLPANATRLKTREEIRNGAEVLSAKAAQLHENDNAGRIREGIALEIAGGVALAGGVVFAILAFFNPASAVLFAVLAGICAIIGPVAMVTGYGTCVKASDERIANYEREFDHLLDDTVKDMTAQLESVGVDVSAFGRKPGMVPYAVDTQVCKDKKVDR